MTVNPSGLFGESLFGHPFTRWCSVCSAEPAVTEVEVEWPVDGEWVPLPIGSQCLTKAQEEGKLDT